METYKICKEYFDMHKAILKERQFNRKVELNIKISNFKRLNNISLECKDLDTEIAKVLSDLKYKSEMGVFTDCDYLNRLIPCGYFIKLD
jgi:hypothetical protein